MLVGGLTVDEGSALPEEQWGGKEGTSCTPHPYHSGVGAPVWRKGWADCASGPPLDVGCEHVPGPCCS